MDTAGEAGNLASDSSEAPSGSKQATEAIASSTNVHDPGPMPIRVRNSATPHDSGPSSFTLPFRISASTPNSMNVMETNDHCIVSKQCVEKLYYDPPHFYQHVVTKPKNRTALINRGYWLRMQAVESALKIFLEAFPSRSKVVFNLGCGLDTLPFRMLSVEPYLCENTKFVDIDYPSIMLEKCKIIRRTPDLNELLYNVKNNTDNDMVLLSSENYMAIGCDLADVTSLQETVKSVLGSGHIYFFLAEVSTTYMSPDAANTIVSWASSFHPSQFCLLEQFLPHGPDHPFASTMLMHFDRLGSRLRIVEKYRTLSDQINRFRNLGWTDVHATSLWRLWADPGQLPLSARKMSKMCSIEPFDEWEEFALFATHYFLLMANNYAPAPVGPPKDRVTYTRIDYSSFAKSSAEQRWNRTRKDGILYKSGDGVFEYHGGEDGTGRLCSTESYILSDDEGEHGKPPHLSISARKCHTITRLNDKLDYLLVGGRGSPYAPFSDCWLRYKDTWLKTHDLPKPLYRHSATAVTIPGIFPGAGVLVFGGLSTNADVSSDWFYWQLGEGWTKIKPMGTPVEPIFGANLINLDQHHGLLSGGMYKRGNVSQLVYHWLFMPGVNGLELHVKIAKDQSVVPCRFGASVMVHSPTGYSLIGGIDSMGLLDATSEISKINLEYIPLEDSIAWGCHWSSYTNEIRPLLIGHSVIHDGQGTCIVGGGAVCFSFGSYTNRGVLRINDAGHIETTPWKVVEYQYDEEDSQPPNKRQRFTIKVKVPRPQLLVKLKLPKASHESS